VLSGEMSLVGPRPEHPDYVRLYTEDQRRLLDVRPGITGPASLVYIDEEEELRGGSPENAYVRRVLPRKLALELAYMEHDSLAMRVRILATTAAAVLRRPFASARDALRRSRSQPE